MTEPHFITTMTIDLEPDPSDREMTILVAATRMIFDGELSPDAVARVAAYLHDRAQSVLP